MLEKQLSVILAKYLEKFICGLHDEQLRVSLWSGDLVLRDLELRANILDQMVLSLFEGHQHGDGVRTEGMDPSEATAEALLMPFTVVRGVVRELVISVPWSALDREPVSVEVRGVEILLGPLRRHPYNAEEDALRVQMVKQKQLRAFEAERSGSNAGKASITSDSENNPPEFGNKNSNANSRSYMEQVIDTISRNVHVSLYDVSIRYVLDYDGLHPTFISELVVSFKEIFVTTTDDEWQDRFVMDLTMPYCKKIVISGLEVSVNAFKQQSPQQEDHQTPTQRAPPQEWGKTMTIVDIPDLTLCLRLPNASSTCFVARAVATRPVRLRTSFGAVGAVALIVDSLRHGLLGVHYRQHLHLLIEPEGSVANRRWRFAIRCVVDDVRRVHSKGGRSGRQCFIDSVMRFGDRRRSYCSLWKRSQGVYWLPGLNETEEAALTALGEALSLEQTIFLRCLAYAALAEERRSHSQQQQYVAAAMRRSTTTAVAGAAAGGGRWFWFASRQSVSVVEERVPECHEDSFDTEWARGARFLQRIAYGQSVGAAVVPVAVNIAAAHVIVELHPPVWREDVAQAHPLLAFLECAQQHMEARVTSLRVKYAVQPTPRDNRVGLGVHIGTASAAFCGEVSVPLFESLHDFKDHDAHQGDAVRGDPSEDWLSLRINEPRTMISASLGRTRVTLHPLCEPCWWSAAMGDFVAALPRYTGRFPHIASTNSSFSVRPNVSSNANMNIDATTTTTTTPPSLDVSVAGVILVVPLTSQSSQLLLHVPSVCFGTSDSGATHCRLSVVDDAPVCVRCDFPNARNVRIVELSELDVDFARVGDISAHVRVQLTVDQRALAAINAYITSLGVAQNSRARLMCLYAQARAQASLIARSRDNTPISSQGPTRSRRLELHVDFARVLVRNAHCDDVAEIELCGGEVDDTVPALFLEVTVAGGADASLVMSVPDLYISTPCGRHVLTLEDFCARVDRANVSVTAASVSVSLCLPLVECAEVLLGAAASLRGPQAEVEAVGLGTESEGLGTESEGLGTGRLTNVSLNRAQLRVVGCGTGTIAANVSQVALCIDGRRRTMNAHLTVELIENVAEDDDDDDDDDDSDASDNVQSFTLLGPSTGSAGAAMTVRVAVEPTPAGTSVRSAVEGGRIGYFHTHWMELASLHKCPPIVRLLAIPTCVTTRRGFLLHEDEVVETEEESCRKVSGSESEPSETSCVVFEADVRALELMLATDARREIDVARAESYCHFFIDSITIRAESRVGSHWRMDASLRGVHYHPEQNGTSPPPLIALADIYTENCTRLASNADGSGYDFSKTADPHDVAVVVMIQDSDRMNKDPDQDTLDKADSLPAVSSPKPAAAFDARLTTSALGSLLSALSHNLMRPAASFTHSAAPSVSSASQRARTGHTSMLLTVPSARLVLIGDESQDAFALRGAAQFFTSHGGTAAGSIAHLRSVTVDDISPSRPVVSRDVPHWRQKEQPGAEMSAGCKKRLLSLESAGVFAVGAATECVIDGLVVTAASRLWARLFGALSRGAAAAAALGNMRSRSGDDNVGKKPQSKHNIDEVSREIIVGLRDCRILLEEPWDEPLATLSLPAVNVRLRESCRVAHLRIDAPVTLEPCDGGPSVLQWVPLEKRRTVSKDYPHDSKLNKTEEDGHGLHDDNGDDSNYINFLVESDNDNGEEEEEEEKEEIEEVESAFLRVEYVAGPTTPQERFDMPNVHRPQFGLSGHLSVVVQGIRIVADVSFIRRLIKYAGAEADVYASLFTAPLAAPLTNVLGLRARVRNAALHLRRSDWRLFIGAFDVSNSYAEAPESLAPGALYCAAITHTLRTRGVRLQHTRLHAVALPGLFVRVATPVAKSVFAESRVTLSVGSDDRTTFRCTYAFVSHPAPPPTFCRRVQVQSATGARVIVFSALHARDVLRAWHDAADHAARHPLPAYYAISPRGAHSAGDVRTSFTLDLPRIALRAVESPQAFGSAVLAELRVRGRVAGQMASAADTALTRTRVALCGAFELLDGQGAAVLYRRAPAGTEPQAHAHAHAQGQGQGQARGARENEDGDTVIEVECVETREERRVRVESNGIVVSLHPHTVDFVLRLQNLFALLVTDARSNNNNNSSSPSKSSSGTNEEVRSGVIDGNNNNDKKTMGGQDSDAASAAAAEEETAAAAKCTVLSIRLSTIAAALENIALLEARGFEAIFERGSLGLQWGPVNERPYSFRIADIVLRQQDGQRAFVRVGGVEVALGVGQVNVRARPVIVNNYDICFFMDVLDCVHALHGYVVQNIKFSKVKEDGFKQSILVSLSDVCVCFFLSKPIGTVASATARATRTRTASTAPSHVSATSAGQGPSGVEIVFPAIVVKQVASTTTRSISFETENGIISYRFPEGRLPPFVKNVSFTYLTMENVVAQSRTTTLNLSPFEAFIPIGDTLQCSVEAVAQTLFPLLPATTALTSVGMESAERGAVLRNENEERGRPVVPPGPPLRDEEISFTVPLVSLNVCCALSDEAALVEPPTVLFGVGVHKVCYEHSRHGTMERTLAQVLFITSSMDPCIQEEFVSATAPCGALDAPSQSALYFCKETISDAKSHGDPMGGDDNNNNNKEVLLEEEQMPSRRVSIVARAHAVRLTVSPQLVGTLNEHVLRHVASGVCRTRQSSTSWVPSRTAARDASSTRSYNSSFVETGDRLLIISSDFCFKADVMLGGRRGSRLHFTKEPINTAPRNRVTIRTINHARVFLSMIENSDGTTEPPIVVDPGLTVVFEGVSLLLEHGKPTDYAVLGPRALLVTSDAHVAVVPSTPAPMPLPRLGCGPSARWYTQHVHFDVSADLVLRLSSHHQTLVMATEAYARYRQEIQRYEGNRGVRDVVDESGEVALSNVSVMSDRGVITPEPTGFVVHVKHRKGDGSPAGTTMLRALVPPTSFTLSIEHLRLLCDMVSQLRCGLAHFGEVAHIISDPPRTTFPDTAGLSVASVTTSSTTGIRASASTTALPSSLVCSHDGDPTPRIDFSLSAATISLTITNDFYRPEASFELNSMALLVRGNRSLNKLTCSGLVNVRVVDYPHAHPPRDLIVVAPELSMEYARYANDGFSLQGALTCAEATLTLPLTTVLRLLHCRAALRHGGPYAFCNSTGVALLVAAAGPTRHALHPNKQAQQKNHHHHHHQHHHQQQQQQSGGKGTPTQLPPGEIVRTDALRYDQTRFYVSAESDAAGPLPAMRASVDLSALHRGATCRVPLCLAVCGVLDGVVRLDETRRLIDVTTCVLVANGLSAHDVCLPAGLLEPFIVRPGETRYATLPALRHSFAIYVGPWRTTARNPLITLDMFVAAFALLPTGGMCAATAPHAPRPRHAHREDDDTLVVPVALRREDTGDVEAAVRVVLTRRPAAEAEGEVEAEGEAPRWRSQLLPKYEVELRVCPILAIANETGATLAVCIGGGAERLLPHGAGDLNWLTPLPEGSTLRVALVFGESGGRLECAEPLLMDFAGKEATMALCGEASGALMITRAAHDRLVVRAAAILHNALPFAVFVAHADGILLTTQPRNGVAPGLQIPVLHTVHNPGAPLLRVRAGGPGVLFSPPFTCGALGLSGMLESTGESVARFFQARRVAGGGAAAVPEVRLEALWLFRNRSCALSLEVRALPAHAGTAPIRDITRHNNTNDNNNNNNGSDANDCDGVRVIHPLLEMEWTDFATATAADPRVQVRFSGSAGLFEWSEPIRLTTLSGTNVPVAVKHLVRGGGTESFAKAGITVFSCTRVPLLSNTLPTRESFACLSVTPSRQGGQFVVEFALDVSVSLVLENRTAWTLQYQQLPQQSPQQRSVQETRDGSLRAYLVKPFTDCATCLDGDDASPVLQLTLFDVQMHAVRCVVDLEKSASTREVVRVSENMYVLCTYNYDLQRYYVSVTTNRSLEGTLVFQPRYIVHFETFVRSLTMHIASLCVPKKETSIHNTPLGALALRNQLQLGFAPDTEPTNAEILSALQSRELDVVLLHAIGLYGAFSLNEKHHLGRVDVGHMALVDCTNPRPNYPLVLGLQNPNKEHAVYGKPSVSLKFHALVPKGDIAPDSNQCTEPRMVTIPFESISLDIAPLTVKLSDSFLYVLLQSYMCMLEATQEYEDDDSGVQMVHVTDTILMAHRAPKESCEATITPEESNENNEEEQHSHSHEHQTRKQAECNEEIQRVNAVANKVKNKTEITRHPSLLSGPVLYNCRIARLCVSQVELALTLTRRADGRYDPFTGLSLGSHLIPSVDDAPISIVEMERYDVNQVSSSHFGALASVLWPWYRNQLLMQLYKVVGSLEILGNPIALMSGWHKGVRSFLTETVRMNLLKGARELLRATASSTLHSVGLLSRAGGRTAAAISLDSEWLEDRDAEPGGGVLRGIAHGLRGGLESVISRPLDGARAAGIAGFCTGIAAGGAGLVARPVAGTLDGLGHTVEFLARMMREPDDVPNAYIEHLSGGRNFVTAERQKQQILGVNMGQVHSLRITPHTAEMRQELQPVPVRDYAELFISRAVYNQITAQVDYRELVGADAARFLIKTIGPHNYALHTDWPTFVAYTTPEEFHNWVSIALIAAMSVRLEEITMLGDTVMDYLTSVNRSRGFENGEHDAIERARNIKNTLGARDMLSYVSLEHFVRVCSLDEIKSNVSPMDLHRKLPKHLLAGVKASLDWIMLPNDRWSMNDSVT